YEGFDCFLVTKIYAFWIQSYYLFRDSGSHNKYAFEISPYKAFGFYFKNHWILSNYFLFISAGVGGIAIAPFISRFHRLCSLNTL
ncbi:MAG: hypothetical protein WAV32_06890, partial [Halobacteriota archaeon]